MSIIRNTATATASASASFPIFGLLGVLFVGLKLTHFINWSWWWVLAPFWVPFAVGLLVLVVVLVIAVVVALGDK